MYISVFGLPLTYWPDLTLWCDVVVVCIVGALVSLTVLVACYARAVPLASLSHPLSLAWILWVEIYEIPRNSLAKITSSFCLGCARLKAPFGVIVPVHVAYETARSRSESVFTEINGGRDWKRCSVKQNSAVTKGNRVCENRGQYRRSHQMVRVLWLTDQNSFSGCLKTRCLT